MSSSLTSNGLAPGGDGGLVQMSPRKSTYKKPGQTAVAGRNDGAEINIQVVVRCRYVHLSDQGGSLG